jgi:hypothetical protein
VIPSITQPFFFPVSYTHAEPSYTLVEHALLDCPSQRRLRCLIEPPARQGRAMHQSPQKQLGGARREKYAALEAFAGEDDVERRLQRGNQPKARKFPLRQEISREERDTRQHPRG